MPITEQQPGLKKSASIQKVEKHDFRDQIATADKDGNRRWIYPKKVTGMWFRYRTWFSWLLLGIMFAGPFIRINGNPLLMINVVDGKFSILGQIFWPQDMVIFAVAMLLFLTSIIIFTTAFGRLWCGWACPQTVLMEMVFRKIEYLIEGDGPTQRALNAAPWGWRKAVKKIGKQVIFFGVSFIIANWLLSYIIGMDQLLEIVKHSPRHHVTGLSFMMLFTLVFYTIFARFREQACTFICPYGRFQSAMLDENTMVVAYDYKRGEKRSPLRQTQSLAGRLAEGLGDCVNCRLCVTVCPTGIDIRDGTQMECVNCTACIDACDGVMTKIGRPKGLIRYASQNSIEKGEKFRFTARMGWYSVVLGGLTGLLVVLIFTRSEVETMLLRAPGGLYQQTADGAIANLYTLKVVNKTSRDIPLEVRLENVEGRVQVMGAGSFVVPKEDLAQTSVLIELEKEVLTGTSTKLQLGIYSEGRKLETVKTAFAGPRP